MGVGRNSLNVYLSFRRVPSESISSFTGWWNFIYIYIYIYNSLAWRPTFLSKILSAFFIRSLGPRFAPSVHGDISLQNWFSYSLFPLDEKWGYFRFKILANHLAFFLPFPGHRLQTCVGFHSVGNPFGLLSLSPEGGYRVQRAWPIFFSSFNGRLKLTYILYFSFNGQSLAAC